MYLLVKVRAHAIIYIENVYPGVYYKRIENYFLSIFTVVLVVCFILLFVCRMDLVTPSVSI